MSSIRWPLHHALSGSDTFSAGRASRTMDAVRLHPQELERLASLRSYAILDSTPEPVYDRLVQLAATLLHAPMAALSFVDSDRQWHKASVGPLQASAARSASICSDVVAVEQSLVVPDTHRHPRYRELSSVIGAPGIRAYAGVPVIGRDGLALGALCVLDTTPRHYGPTELQTLTALAEQAAALLDLRRSDEQQGLAPLGTSEDRLVAEARDPRALRRALTRGEFTAHFQPIVRLHDDQVVGHEALARWQHPQHGLLTPERFLPAFETGELICALDAAVLEHALNALPRLRATASAPLHVAVNLSARELTAPGAAARVLAALDRHDLPSSCLAVEVTESAMSKPLIRDRELRQLRERGITVLLDDYGTGYANLLALLDTPATGLKLDRSLVSRIASDRRARRLLGRVAAAGRDLGLTTVAEGVEDRSTASLLRELDVDLAQGYFYGRPSAAPRTATTCTTTTPDHPGSS
ncbi:sensor domain-containing phosphodiesterase [Vallicoccus soli]|uniref:sensor domain-containing phosphodiesterase n=1 Tax=Vallicoccus soli TaxID=2339232 RepID=UPI00140414F9|nr:EAL domain-containing protein [Vallicoccus soli]